MRRLYHKLAKKAIVLALVGAVSFFDILAVRAAVPNDPNYPDQQKFYRQMNAEEAWDVTTGTKKVVVAFIDTGLDIWHDDIRDNVWVNPHEIPDNNKDDDLNGYVDDINGWNFVENNSSVRPQVFDQSDDKEAVRHGTLVGGLIGAKGNNELWGTGMAQNVSLMPIRAIKSDGSGSVGAVLKAIDYAVNNGANVLSLSFMGEKFDQRIYDALRSAYKRGVVIVSAAGNYDNQTENGDTSKRLIYPACFDAEDNTGENWILAVGSIDASDKLSEFSEYGKCLDVLAPGEYIFSTERYAPQYGYTNQFGGPWFGTSFSTPLVAGVAALIKSIHPEYTPKEVIQTILTSADNIDANNPEFIGQLGRGRVNAGRALSTAMATPIKRGLGNLWYFKNNHLWSFNAANYSASLIATMPFGKVVGFTSYFNYLNDEAAVLMTRNKGYYLDVYMPNGDVRRSIAVSANAIIGGRATVRFDGLNYYLVSTLYSKTKNNTEFRIYKTADKKIVIKTVPGKIINFDVDGAGNVFYTTLNKGSLKIISLSKNDILLTLKDVAKIYDFKVMGGQLMLLMSKGSRVVLYNSSVDGALVQSKIVNANTRNDWKLKVIMFANKMYYMPFSNLRGAYELYDSNLTPALTINLNSLPGEVK